MRGEDEKKETHGEYFHGKKGRVGRGGKEHKEEKEDKEKAYHSLPVSFLMRWPSSMVMV